MTVGNSSFLCKECIVLCLNNNCSESFMSSLNRINILLYKGWLLLMEFDLSKCLLFRYERVAKYLRGILVPV